MPNQEMLTAREEIYDYWMRHLATDKALGDFVFPDRDRWIAFCVAKDWLQDAGEALLFHRRRGFSSDPYSAYIEILGVLQATFVSQDAINEMRYAVNGPKGKKIDPGPAWQRLRKFRNLAIGHPTRNVHNPEKILQRSTMDRSSKSYEHLRIRVMKESEAHYENINLGNMLDDFDIEAAAALRSILESVQRIVSTFDSSLACGRLLKVPPHQT